MRLFISVFGLWTSDIAFSPLSEMCCVYLNNVNFSDVRKLLSIQFSLNLVAVRACNSLLQRGEFNFTEAVSFKLVPCASLQVINCNIWLSCDRNAL